jgi:arylsulfatase A-like enzyme
VQTPNIDSLASGGQRFSSAYTPHAVCTPARTSLLTGQYGSRHKVLYNINLDEKHPDPPSWAGLSADQKAFPERLLTQGYNTSLFGKLHTVQQGGKSFGLEHLKLAEGKAQFVPYRSGMDDYRRYLKEKGYEDGDWRAWEKEEYRSGGFVTSSLKAEDYIDSWIATEALRYLETVDCPFFCWISFCGPHTPWDPPRPYDSLYSPNQIPMPHRRKGELEEKNPEWVDLVARTIPATPPTSHDPTRAGGLANAYRRLADDQIRRMLAAYFAQLSLIDEQVGRILNFLEEQELLDDTLVVFTADHGDYLGNNWAFYKYGAQYRSLSRIPLIVSWPRGFHDRGLAPGSMHEELVSLLDLSPTFLEVSGSDSPDSIDGRSLLPLLRGDSPPKWRKELILEPGTDPRVFALLTEQWHYLHWSNGFEELYDRETDPGQLFNRAADFGGVAADLKERLIEKSVSCK